MTKYEMITKIVTVQQETKMFLLLLLLMTIIFMVYENSRRNYRLQKIIEKSFNVK